MLLHSFTFELGRPQRHRLTITHVCHHQPHQDLVWFEYEFCSAREYQVPYVVGGLLFSNNSHEYGVHNNSTQLDNGYVCVGVDGVGMHG